ncbi:MAG: sn-glycerol-1-phosphate dehydrogenase [Propionibacteriaceae bacterium]|jgi:glycerol-1-phosphate dehydrogenase [NAD(P)+]|nr:sn-glycerol-1-phosphate dehydrogenase [Propionibacteriaceae bacterium]
MTTIASVLARGLDTRAAVIGTNVLDQTGPTFAAQFPGARAVIVADGNTWAVAGDAVAQSLAQAGILTDEPIVYPATPTLFADDHTVDDLTARLGATDAVAVSIASGSLNDVTKLSSHRNNRSYLNVCTAASVDGYTSFGAAITVNGVKGTQECPAPRAVIVPLDIMAAAPTRLTATGYGDLIEKIPAGADWIVADELGREHIDDDVWGLVQGPLRDALADPVGLRKGDLTAITKLSEGLIMSGLAMQVMGSSRPASGAGHYFSHQWEMEGLGREWEPPLSHGFKVGLGTVAMCALYEQFLKLDMTRYDIAARLAHWPSPQADEARVRALQSNPVICEASVIASAGKYVTSAHAEAWLHHILDRWGALESRVASQVLLAAVVEDMLRQVGAVHHPAQVGLSLEDLRHTYYQAQTIRTRYTSLDTLQELGLLNTVVDSLFAPGGYWHTRPTPED